MRLRLESLFLLPKDYRTFRRKWRLYAASTWFFVLGGAVWPLLARTMIDLPELGDSSGAVVTHQQERKLGEEGMREFRMSGAYLSDPEVNGYLNSLGQRILAANPSIRDRFEFFVVGDTSINAFAMPGGYIGVNLGLILLTQSESELVSVLTHEMAHVTQKHYARMVDDQRKNAWLPIVGLAAAVLAAKSGNVDAAQGALFGSQAAQIQNYLNFSRDNEREADRVGFQYLSRSQFDTSAMAIFMERLQRSSTLNDTGIVPGYLRTHPVSVERIADARNRSTEGDFRLARENPDFHYVRALLRSYVGDPREAVTYFEAQLAERKYASETATRYGLAAALLRAREFERAKNELTKLDAKRTRHPMITAMYGQLLLQNNEIFAAVRYLEKAVVDYPEHLQLQYDLPEALLLAREPRRALAAAERALVKWPNDGQLLTLAARSSADSGLNLKQHRYLGEQYYRQGNLRAALDQFELASKAGQGDYYEVSYVEARIRDLKREIRTTEKER